MENTYYIFVMNQYAGVFDFSFLGLLGILVYLFCTVSNVVFDFKPSLQPKLRRLYMGLYLGIYAAVFLRLLWPIVNNAIFPSPGLYAPVLFIMFHIFFALGYANWTKITFFNERLFCYYLVFVCTLLTAGVWASPLALLIIMDVASFAALLLVGLEGTRGARWSAFYYLIMTSLASAVYSLGLSMEVLPHFGYVMSPAEFFEESNLNPTAVGRLLLSLAFAIKLGVGPFWYYMLNAQKFGSFADFVFLSTLAKLPHLCALYQMKFYMGPSSLWLIAVVVISGLAAAVIMAEEDNMRGFLAYGSLANHTVFLILLFALPPVSEPVFFFITYIVFYSLLSMTFYYSYVLITTSYNLVHQEPTTMKQLRFHMLESHPIVAMLFTYCLLTVYGLPPAGIFMAKAILISCGFQMPGSAFYFMPNVALPIATLLSICMAPFYLRMCYVILTRGVYVSYTKPMILLPWNPPKLPLPDYPVVSMLPIKFLTSMMCMLTPLYFWLLWHF